LRILVSGELRGVRMDALAAALAEAEKPREVLEWRVRTGARLLDDCVPQWRSAVEADVLNFVDPDAALLVQLFGDDETGLATLLPGGRVEDRAAVVVACGFAAVSSDLGDAVAEQEDHGAYAEALTELWRQEIARDGRTLQEEIVVMQTRQGIAEQVAALYQSIASLPPSADLKLSTDDCANVLASAHMVAKCSGTLARFVRRAADDYLCDEDLVEVYAADADLVLAEDSLLGAVEAFSPEIALDAAVRGLKSGVARTSPGL
jgi:hypothetical protein